jgi:hypothetical protein
MTDQSTNTAPKEKAIKVRQTAAPVNVARLRDKLGASAAAEKLGISTSGLHTMIDRNRSSATVELLARRLLEDGGERPQSGSRLLIIKVTPTQMAGLKPVIEAFGARIAFADDA